jgi:YD repeat-containing protein
VRDAGGRLVGFEYDTRNKLSSVKLPMPKERGWYQHRRFAYDQRGDLIEVRDALGKSWRFEYNGHLLVQETDWTGLSFYFQYDGRGPGAWCVRTWGDGGIYDQVIDYDKPNRRTVVTNSLGAVTQYDLDENRLIELVYDTEDQLTAVVNEAGERYEYMLDALGNVAAETGFDGFKRVHFRDELGRIKQTLLPSGRKISYNFDAASQVTEVTHSDGTSVQFEYGPDGSLVRALNNTAEVSFERDALGRVIAETAGDITVTSRYSADGERSLLESSLGARQAIVTDALGEVASLHHGRSAIYSDIPVMRFERDAMGFETARELPGGIRLEWSRDELGRPTERRTLRTVPGARPIELNTQAYLWRGEDQIAAIIDSARGPRWFDHDDRGRLIRERRPGPSAMSGDEVLHRAMDAVGNIYRSPRLDDRRYGPGGRVEEAGGTKYEHDEDGNLVERVDPDGSAWTYRWNGAGMLTEVERPDGRHVAFEYDAFSRRTKKVVFTNDESALEGPRDPKARRLLGLPPSSPEQIVESETRYVWDGHTVLHELSSNE